jgi:hypothetical protein
VLWHGMQPRHSRKRILSLGTRSRQIMRYQTTINRQFFQAMNQLKRLQRLRKGDNVPVNLEVFSEPPTAATRRLYLTNLTRGILLSLLQLSLGRGFVEIIRKR